MAAHSLYITDGTTNININTSGLHVTREYEQNTIDTSKDDQDGEPTITETLTITLQATTGPLLQTAVRQLESFLVAAKRRNDTKSQLYKTGPRIYLMLQVDGEAAAWRAEILEGHFQPDKEMLKIGWPNLQADGALMITHRIWEGQEKELSLSTSNAAAATGGQTIYNHDDAGTGHDNWVQIASTQVGGVLSTPVKLTLTNSSGSAVGFRNFYLACNAFSDPANLVHMLEGEAAVGGSSTVDANSSSGNYYHYTFTTTGEIQWSLTAAQMQRTQGRTFRLLARMFSWSGTNLFVKVLLKDATGTVTLWGQDNDEILLGSSGSQIIDLGALPLPNGGYQVAWGDMRLALELRCTGAGVFNIDFMQLTPLDAYQVVNQRGLSISNGDVLTFDSIEGVMYATTGQPIYSPLHGQLRVFPNVTQKLIILSDEGTSSNIARTFTVRAYIRERRLTV